jgi:hypothetical protein
MSESCLAALKYRESGALKIKAFFCRTAEQGFQAGPVVEGLVGRRMHQPSRSRAGREWGGDGGGCE